MFHKFVGHVLVNLGGEEEFSDFVHALLVSLLELHVWVYIRAHWNRDGLVDCCCLFIDYDFSTLLLLYGRIIDKLLKRGSTGNSYDKYILQSSSENFTLSLPCDTIVMVT